MTAELELIARLKNEAKAGIADLRGGLKDMGVSAEKSSLQLAAVKQQSQLLESKTNELARAVAKGEKSFEDAEKELGDYKRGLTDLGDQTDKAGQRTQLLGNVLKGALVAGTAAAVAGVGLLVRGLTTAVQSTFEIDAVQTQLAQTVESTGMAAGLTTAELLEMADGLEEVTNFSAEAVNRGQALLLTFTNIGEEVFPRATEAALDMAEVFGSVDAAAVQLGKALNDPVVGVTALQRVGVSFTESQKEQIRVLQESGDLMGAQTVILDELARQFGGQAREAADTFDGSLIQINNHVGEAQELIGFALVPALKDLADDMLPAVDRAVNTAAESLDTQLIPLGHDVVDLFREMVETGGQVAALGEDMDFEEVMRRTRNGVILVRIALAELREGMANGFLTTNQVTASFERLRAVEVDVTRKTDLMSVSIEHMTDEAMISNIIRSEQMTAAYGGASVALSDLEITSNLYIGTAEDAAEVTEDVELALLAEEEAALRAMMALQRHDTQSGAYEVTAEQVEAAELARAEAHDEAALATDTAAAALAAAQVAAGNYFQEILEGSDVSRELNDVIFNQAIAAGATIEELEGLAVTLFGYSEAEAAAAAAGANLRTEQDRLIVTFGTGALTADQMRLAMDLLEQGLADTSEEARFMAQTALPNTTESLGLMNTAALTAKEGILGLTAEVMTYASNSPYSATVEVDDQATPTIEEIKRGLAGIPDETVIVTVQYEQGPPPPGVGDLPAPDQNLPAPAFQHGGFTGHGTGFAGLVHHNEFVFNPEATRNIGVGLLERLHDAARGGPRPGGPGPPLFIDSSPSPGTIADFPTADTVAGSRSRAGGRSADCGCGDFIYAPVINISSTAVLDERRITGSIQQELQRTGREAEAQYRMRR